MLKKMLCSFLVLGMSAWVTMTSASTFNVVTSADVRRSSSSEPAVLQQDFSQDEVVNAFVSVNDIASQSYPRVMKAQWYRCDALVSEREKVLETITKNSERGKHHVWFWIDARPVGAGQHRVEIFADGERVGVAKFNIKNEHGELVDCNGRSLNSRDTFVLSSNGLMNANGDALFKFDRAKEGDVYATSLPQLDAIAQQLKSQYSQINRLTIIGHTDPLGAPEYNMSLSRERANTISQALVSRGVVANEVQAMGKGETEPVVRCDMNTPRGLLIECLAPNRRVEIVVEGVKR